VTLEINGKDLASEYIGNIEKSSNRRFDQLKARFKFISNHDRYENDSTFNDVGDGVYEFKAHGNRLYCFYDELNCQEEKLLLIIATNGGGKQKKKSQQGDIKKAKELRNEYFQQKTRGATIKILE